MMMSRQLELSGEELCGDPAAATRTNCLFAIDHKLITINEHSAKVTGKREVQVVLAVPAKRLDV
jgi:hypothetical protein